MKHISTNMRYAGKRVEVCDHFCRKKVRNTKFYHWFTFLDNKFIKTMCEKCALREAWGYNYKQTKYYRKWVDNV